VTVAGTVADPLLLESDTTVPPVPDAAPRVTVPVEEDPPRTVDGVRVTETRGAGVMVRVAFWVRPLRAAVITAETLALTAVVATVNVALVCPPDTRRDPGTVADAAPLDKFTTTPDGPTGPEKVTVPVEGLPPATDAGFRLTAVKVAGLMVSTADWMRPLSVAWIVAVVLLSTGVVVAVNVPVICPAGMVTDSGTVAAALVLDSETIRPAGPAAPLRVTVPVDEDPPLRLAGFRLTDTRVAGVMVNLAICDALPWVAEMFAIATAATPVVGMLKVPLTCPAATVTLAGTVAAVLLLSRLTMTPLGPA
jgi:hypothetical protein